MKRASDASASGGRFQKKRPRVEAIVSELTPSVVEALSLEKVMTPPAPQQHFHAPFLCVNDKRAYLRLGQWLEVKFGVDTRVWDRGAASEDPAPVASRPENARLNVTLTGENLRVLEALDRKMEALFASMAETPFTWQSLVKRSEKSSHAHMVIKVNFVLRPGSNVHAATEIKIRNPKGTVSTGLGWGFFEANMASCEGFKNGRCKALLDAQYWCMNGSAGVTLNAAALALRPSEDCFSPEHFRIDEVFPDAEM
jgi:hypothetical protein